MEDLPILHTPAVGPTLLALNCLGHWSDCKHTEHCYYADACKSTKIGVDFASGPDRTIIHPIITGTVPTKLAEEMNLPPEKGMTEEQKDFFISMAQIGVCMGLDTPLEWLLNYQTHQSSLEKYADIPERLQLSWETMFAFYQHTGPEFEEMTLKEFQSWVDLQIETGRKYMIDPGNEDDPYLEVREGHTVCAGQSFDVSIQAPREFEKLVQRVPYSPPDLTEKMKYRGWWLRHLWALLTQPFAPAHVSTCYCCGIKWTSPFANAHTTYVTPNSGMFPLCEFCWSRLPIFARVPYYRELFEEWQRQLPEHNPESNWAEIDHAVRFEPAQSYRFSRGKDSK